MKPKFLIQTEVFQENEIEIFDEIKNTGYECKSIKYTPSLNLNDLLNLYKPEECVVFYGSIHLAKIIIRECPWIPGVYFNEKKFNCNYYYPKYNNYLLNRDYILMPIGDVINNKNLINSLYKDNQIFIRPNNGIKSFSGCLFELDKLEQQIIDIKRNYTLFDEDLVLISSNKKIIEEYRFVIIEGKVITGSIYSYDDVLLNKMDEKAKQFAEKVCLEIKDHLEQAYTMDVCLFEKNGIFDYKIVELNSFSCSGFYHCDKELIFKNIAEIALKEWSSYG